jgi:hypothetical protein
MRKGGQGNDEVWFMEVEPIFLELDFFPIPPPRGAFFCFLWKRATPQNNPEDRTRVGRLPPKSTTNEHVARHWNLDVPGKIKILGWRVLHGLISCKTLFGCHSAMVETH